MLNTLAQALSVPNATLSLPRILDMAEESGYATATAEVPRSVRAVLADSLNIRHVDTGSCNACDWEMTHLLSPVYDIQRFGLDFVASPRHADMIMVTGCVSEHLREALLSTYRCMGEPKLVMALGDCACGCGHCPHSSYASHGAVSAVLPVDIELRGCPPPPAAIVKSLLGALGRI